MKAVNILELFFFVLILLPLFLLEKPKTDYDIGAYIVEDVYATLISLDKANLLDNITLLKNSLKFVIEKNFCLIINNTNYTPCNGEYKYTIWYIYFNKSSNKTVEIKVLI